MILYRYTVRGEGVFPVDMLRHDSCWPARQDDVAPVITAQRDERSVTVTGIQPPTEGRWRSFGWVVDGGPRRVKA